ncbi:hypothetical protein [Actinocorallia sp. A-T 12471]|uniref:hypothetical protein n=1 Tax=Actinocorallia sp. A-T 12471 TaxID=3089813 RepID=UPI0029D05235|nr:hypothetical protein [Actinocorallia sp. A-T 12471]MDX6738732.1 hypothetical protein [Actinocorallia sp. A-T 12471]
MLDPSARDLAHRQADAAAGAAGVRVESVADPARLHAVARLLADVWETPPGADPLPADVLRSLAHAGGAVHAAYGPQSMIGASAAIWGPPEDRDVYSMIAGAHRTGGGVGYALKLAQRAWAMERGAATITWTFDPLIRRNAWFNLVKLGATAPEYTADFYGPMNDVFNAGDESDRLTVRWRLAAFRPGRATDPAPRPSPEPSLAPDGMPYVARQGDAVWCRVPEDILAVRAADPARALGWRHAVREVFQAAEGLTAVSISRDGWYHLTPEPAPEPTPEETP